MQTLYRNKLEQTPYKKKFKAKQAYSVPNPVCKYELYKGL